MKVIKKREIERKNFKILKFLFPELDLEEKKKISTKFQEKDQLIFEFKETPSGKETIVLFSALRGAERIKFNDDDKIFLGVFPDEISAMAMVYRISFFIQEIFETRVKKKIFLKEEGKFILCF